MVASNATVDGVLKVLRKHMPKEKVITILKDLCGVPGNNSFRNTIELLLAKAKQLD